MAQPKIAPSQCGIDIDPDIAVARAYSREVKIACDDLHDNPFDPQARARIIEIANNSAQADEAWARVLRRDGCAVTRRRRRSSRG
jgi:hypothetical protein